MIPESKSRIPSTTLGYKKMETWPVAAYIQDSCGSIHIRHTMVAARCALSLLVRTTMFVVARTALLCLIPSQGLHGVDLKHWLKLKTISVVFWLQCQNAHDRYRWRAGRQNPGMSLGPLDPERSEPGRQDGGMSLGPLGPYRSRAAVKTQA